MQRGRSGTPRLRAWALVVGYVGAASALAPTLLLWAAPLYGTGRAAWMWLDAANDVLSVVVVPAQAIALVLLWRAIRPAPVVATFTWLTIAALIAGAAATVAMLSGAATTDTQTLFTTPMLVLLSATLLVTGIRMLRDRREQPPLDLPLAVFAIVVGVSGAVGPPLDALAQALPDVGTAKTVLFTLGGVMSGISYVMYPVWRLILGLRRDAGVPTTAGTDEYSGIRPARSDSRERRIRYAEQPAVR